MPHNLTWRDPTLIGGNHAFTRDADGVQSVQWPDTAIPTNGTIFRHHYHISTLYWAILQIANVGRGAGGYGQTGERNYNPDRLTGRGRPIPKSAYLRFASQGDGFFQLASDLDPQNIQYSDFTFQDPNAGPGFPAEDLSFHHGKPMHMTIAPGMWIEIGAVTGQGYIDSEGVGRILEKPGRSYLITDVQYSGAQKGRITVYEPGIPAKTSVDEFTDDLDGWLWVMIFNAPARRIDNIPIFEPAAIPDPATGETWPEVWEDAPITEDDAGELRIQQDACEHDRIIFLDRGEHDSGGPGDYNGVETFAVGGNTYGAKSCEAKDLRDRRDWGVGQILTSDDSETYNNLNAPYHVYPDFNDEISARLGMDGPVIGFCGGDDKRCIRFTTRVIPTSFQTPVEEKLAELLGGFEVVRYQLQPVWLGLFDAAWQSNVSIRGYLGGPFPTAGGPDGQPAVIWGEAGGVGALVDQRVDNGFGTLTGWYGSWFHRPFNLVNATALQLSACARFLGGQRRITATGQLFTDVGFEEELERTCDTIDGATIPGYGWPVPSYGNTYLEQQMRSTTDFFTGDVNPRTFRYTQPANEELKITLSAPHIPTWTKANKKTLLSRSIDAISFEGVIDFDFSATTSPSQHVVASRIETQMAIADEANDSGARLSDFKEKPYLFDALTFPQDSSLPPKLYGRSFAIRTAIKDLITPRDRLTLFDIDGDVLDEDALMVGKTVTFERGRTFWVPGAGNLVVKRAITGQATVTLTPGVDYDYDPCGNSADGGWHIHVTSTSTVESEIIIELRNAILPLNRPRVPHIQELRTLIENANTMEVTMEGGPQVSVQYYKRIFYQEGGANDPKWNWASPPAPTVGPWDTDVIGLEGPEVFSIPGNFGINWQIGNLVSGPLPYDTVQLKEVVLPSLIFPRTRFRASDVLEAATMWMKITLHGNNDLEVGNDVAIGLVKRPRLIPISPSENTNDYRCINEHIFGIGSCKGAGEVNGSYASESLFEEYSGAARFAPAIYPDGGDPDYPQFPGGPASSIPDTWATNCSSAQGAFRSDLWFFSAPAPAAFDQDYLLESGATPFANARYLKDVGPGLPRVPTFPDIVAPTAGNFSASAPLQQRLNCPFFFSQPWGPPVAVSPGVVPNGLWQQFNILNILQHVVDNADDDTEWGLVIGNQAALDITLNTTPGAWKAWQWESILGRTVPVYEVWSQNPFSFKKTWAFQFAFSNKIMVTWRQTDTPMIPPIDAYAAVVPQLPWVT
jgi:hypothetical protein